MTNVSIHIQLRPIAFSVYICVVVVQLAIVNADISATSSSNSSCIQKKSIRCMHNLFRNKMKSDAN